MAKARWRACPVGRKLTPARAPGEGPAMLQNDFIGHLARKGVLRDPQSATAAPPRRRDAGPDMDWVGQTKLTQSGFADELAVFYGCARVQRGDLVGGRFAGGQLSPRFLREMRLYPYEDAAGTLTLAIAGPTDSETVRAAELALNAPVTIAVTTPDDIDAALATTLEKERASTDAPAQAAAGDDDLDDLRDLARGAPVVRALDDLLRLAVEQRATDLHI